ncbi:MAG: RHS repeat-associated core domain-containing protein [Planctomycetota bacterium]
MASLGLALLALSSRPSYAQAPQTPAGPTGPAAEAPEPIPANGNLQVEALLSADAVGNLDGARVGGREEVQLAVGERPFWGNTSRCGAPPLDLGAALAPSGPAPAEGFDRGRKLVRDVLGTTPLADAPGYGAAYAFGAAGTVSPATGAFVHPFTLLTVPADVPESSLALRAVYASNMVDPTTGFRPFGPRFALSGYDVLVRSSGQCANGAATSVTLYRGDGDVTTYVLQTANCTSYDVVQGIFDSLSFDAASDQYRRRLADTGHTIVYQRIASTNQYRRKGVVDQYGNTIYYLYNDALGQPTELSTILDIRNVKIVFTWGTVAGQRRVVRIGYDRNSVGMPNLADGDLEIDLAYDPATAALTRIAWFNTEVIRDSQAPLGRLNVQTETSKLRPALRLTWHANGHIWKVYDDTYVSQSVLRIHNEWSQDAAYGWRVVKQGEGDLQTTTIIHSFDYSAWPTFNRTVYVNPIGTAVTVTMNPNLAVTGVTMAAAILPRDAEFGVGTDHQSLDWTIGYNAPWGLPSSIVTPLGRTFTFGWSAATGALESVTVAKSGLQVKHGFDYETIDTSVKKAYSYEGTTQRMAHTFVYARSGESIQSVTISSEAYTDARGTSHLPIVRKLNFNGRGQLIEQTDGEGTATRITYRTAVESGRYFEATSSVGPAVNPIVTTLTTDDLGRVTGVARGGAGRETKYAYDTLRRVKSITSCSCAGLTYYSYDRHGRLAVRRVENRDENGVSRPRAWVQEEWLYDDLGRLAVTNNDQAPLDAASEDVLSTAYFYRADHLPQTVVMPNGSANSVVWDGYRFHYKTVHDQAGVAFVPARHFYDRDGMLVRIRDGAGADRLIQRDALGMLDAVLDPTGRGKVQVVRDGLRRVQEVVAISLVSSATVARVGYDYDEMGEVIRVKKWIHDAGSDLFDTALILRNGRGQVIELAETDKRSDANLANGYRRGWRAAYDDYGRLLWQADKMSDDSPTAASPKLNILAYQYQQVTGLLEKVVTKELEQADFTSPAAQGTQVTREDEIGYDAMDRVVSQKQWRQAGSTSGPQLIHHQFKYDSLNNQVEAVDALGSTVRYAFDGLGRIRLREVVGQNGDTIQAHLNYVLNTTETRVDRTDGLGRLTSFLFDKVGRLAQIRKPGYANGTAHLTEIAYDVAGRIEYLRLGHNPTTRTVIKHTYDAAGRLQRRGLEGPVPFGLSLLATAEQWIYDDIGRLESQETFYGTAQTSSMVQVAEKRDSLGHVLQSEFGFLGGGPTLTLRSDYHPTYGSTNDLDYHNRRSLEVDSPGTTYVRYETTPDRVGRTQVGRLKIGGGAVSTLARFRFGGPRLLERELYYSKVAHSTVPGWDGQSRLDSLTVRKGSTPLWSYAFTRDDEGHTLTRQYDRVGVAAGGGDKLLLDEFSRITGAKLGVPGGSEWAQPYAGTSVFQKELAFGLDDAQGRTQVDEWVGSNHTQTAYQVESTSHRYSSVGGVGFLYDGEGNLVYDGNLYYIYDFKNRLSEVYRYVPGALDQGFKMDGPRGSETRYVVTLERLQQLHAQAVQRWIVANDSIRKGMRDVWKGYARGDYGPSASGTIELVAYYGYDPMNRRVYRMAGSGSTGYTTSLSSWDGWREIQEVEYLGGTTVAEKRVFVWGNGIDELLCVLHKEGSSFQKYCVHQSESASVAQLVASNGAVVERYEYDPFGQTRVYDGAGNPIGSTSARGNPYGFAGRRLDPETGLYYMRNRYYAPALGRFMSTDPSGNWADAMALGNSYAFVGNMPTDYCDPQGEGGLFGALIGGLIGGAVGFASSFVGGLIQGKSVGQAARDAVPSLVAGAVAGAVVGATLGLLAPHMATLTTCQQVAVKIQIGATFGPSGAAVGAKVACSWQGRSNAETNQIIRNEVLGEIGFAFAGELLQVGARAAFRRSVLDPPLPGYATGDAGGIANVPPTRLHGGQ